MKERPGGEICLKCQYRSHHLACICIVLVGLNYPRVDLPTGLLQLTQPALLWLFLPCGTKDHHTLCASKPRRNAPLLDSSQRGVQTFPLNLALIQCRWRNDRWFVTVMQINRSFRIAKIRGPDQPCGLGDPCCQANRTSHIEALLNTPTTVLWLASGFRDSHAFACLGLSRSQPRTYSSTARTTNLGGMEMPFASCVSEGGRPGQVQCDKKGLLTIIDSRRPDVEESEATGSQS